MSQFGPTRPLLAIDTSSAQGSVALYDGRSLSCFSWHADRSHTRTLLAEVYHLFESAAVDSHDLAAIGIAIGPGTFTGLRVGFGVAKGLHLATGVPLIGIPTLEAAALPYAVCNAMIVACVSAGRGRLVWAHFRSTEGRLDEARAARNGTAVELAAEIEGLSNVIVVGELDADQETVIASVPGASLPPSALRYRQPASFAELAWRRLLMGQFDDPERIEPIYLSR